MSVNNLEKMIQLIELNLYDNNVLSALSEGLGYSKFYCSKRFHESFDLSIRTYAHRRKMTLAAQDLLTSDRLVGDLAYYYGFSSTEAFSRAFVKVHGITPLKFRKTRPAYDKMERVVLKYDKNTKRH